MPKHTGLLYYQELLLYTEKKRLLRNPQALKRQRLKAILYQEVFPYLNERGPSPLMNGYAVNGARLVS